MRPKHTVHDRNPHPGQGHASSVQVQYKFISRPAQLPGSLEMEASNTTSQTSPGYGYSCVYGVHPSHTVYKLLDCQIHGLVCLIPPNNSQKQLKNSIKTLSQKKKNEPHCFTK